MGTLGTLQRFISEQFVLSVSINHDPV
jgi:hypothetical protein